MNKKVTKIVIEKYIDDNGNSKCDIFTSGLEIPKPEFSEFVEFNVVWRSGEFDMATDGESAAKKAGLKMDRYLNIIGNYQWCLNEFLNKEFHLINQGRPGDWESEDLGTYLDFDKAINRLIQERQQSNECGLNELIELTAHVKSIKSEVD